MIDVLPLADTDGRAVAMTPEVWINTLGVLDPEIRRQTGSLPHDRTISS